MLTPNNHMEETRARASQVQRMPEVGRVDRCPAAPNAAMGTRLWVVGILLVGLVALSGCVNAGTVQPDTVSPIFHNYWDPWAAGMGMAVAMGVALVALSWMYGYLFADERFKAWAKKELVESFYSIAILLTALWVVGSVGFYMTMLPSITPWNTSDAHAWQVYVNLRCNAPAALAPGMERPCHIRIAEDYLQILASGTQMQADDILGAYAPLSVGSTLGISLQGMVDPAGQLRLSPFAGLSQPLETLSGLFDIANKNLMALRFQEYVLDFLHLAFFPLFLTMGLFFRSLYFTRKLGGLLIAIALGFYLVFPLTYVFFHAVLFSMAGPWTNLAAISQIDPGNPQRMTLEIGHQLYPATVSGGAPFTGVQQPNNNSADYIKSATCGTNVSGPGDECNAGDPALQCPPVGRPGDVYCNTNTCRCGPQYSVAAGNTGDFNTDYGTVETNPITHRTQLRNEATFLSRACYPTGLTDAEQSAQEDQNQMFVLRTQRTWTDALLHGWTSAIKAGLIGNFGLLDTNGFIDNLAKLLIFSLIAPFVAIMVSLAGVKALSPMLGGDVEIAGLTRLI